MIQGSGRWLPFISALLLAGVPAVRGQENDVCLECHGDVALREDPETARLFVDADVFARSIHGEFSCSDCHDLLGADPYGHDPDLPPVDCGMCHSDVAEIYAASLHGYARERGNERAPTCVTCHGSHDIPTADSEASLRHRRNALQVCASCHGEAGLLTDELVRLPQAVSGYAQSVHGRALQRGIETVAVCGDCHGVHDVLGILDPRSPINPLNVSHTCGKCHEDIRQQYDASIHGRALQAGILDSPTCNTCHGEHLVVSPKSPEAATYALRLAEEACSRCHADSRLTSKYGMASYVVDTYVDSYHGWAQRWEGLEAATCVSCHTAHWVLPTRDPASTVNPRNVAETCRQCHPEAGEAFALSYTHRTAAETQHPVSRIIRQFYTFAIPGIIGAMVLHNALIFLYYLRLRRRQEEEEGVVERLDRQQVVQHFLLAVSFTILVITGFALRFPDAFWVAPLKWIGMNEDARSVIHRIAAVVLLGVGVWHVCYVAFDRRGRREFLAMIPRWRDVQDAWANLAFYLGRSRRHPRFDQYDYMQKAEYWALVWGTVVMAASGFVLWFPAKALTILPSWAVQASELLHYYEAWLAALAIVVWHFFFVVAHPDVYPMSWTWLTGKMGRRQARLHHPEWLARLEAEAQGGPGPNDWSQR